MDSTIAMSFKWKLQMTAVARNTPAQEQQTLLNGRVV